MYLLFALNSFAYSPVDGISFLEDSKIKTIQISDVDKIEYTFYHKIKTVYPESLVSKAIRASSFASIKKIREIIPGATICRSNEYLEIYEISISELNKEKRFPKEFNFKNEVWGYFDPRTEENKINSIVVTQHSYFYNFQVLSHEIAHHWYSTYCLDSYVHQTSEQFATEIQFSLEYLNDYK